MQLGTAYYPEHWPEDRWSDDLALMQEAGISQIRIAEFAWCRIEPYENEWTWDWLDRIIALAGEHGIDVLLCTPTQAPPNWLTRDYPEVLVGLKGNMRMTSGGRAHGDAASPSYRYYCNRVTEAMGARYGHDKRVVGWQLHNEIGAHSHFHSTNPAFVAAFRNWLRRRYQGDIAELNRRWGTVFWSGEYRDWSEVSIPEHVGAGANPSMRKCVREFGQWLWCDFLAEQAAILRPLCPDQFITHNIAWFGEQFDLWGMHEFCDIVGIDNYRISTPTVTTVSDLYRAASGKQGWAVLETNGQNVSWTDAESGGPGIGSLATSLVRYAIGGARFTSLFRFQTSPSGGEQNHHNGLRDPWGQPQNETIAACQLATEQIGKLTDFIARPRHERVGIVWDTDAVIWAEMHPIEGRRKIPYMGSYCFEQLELQQACHRLGLRSGFTHWQDDWSRFDCVIVWNQLLAEPTDATKLQAYVAAGGTVIANHLYGFLNRDAKRSTMPLPLGATELFGCRVERVLPLGQEGGPRLQIGEDRFAPTQHGSALTADSAEVLGRWSGWQGPTDVAMTGRRQDAGAAIYVGATLQGESLLAALRHACAFAGIEATMPFSAAPGIEVTPERDGWVVHNNGHEAQELSVQGSFTDLLDGTTVSGSLTVPGYGISVLV